MKSVLCYGDSNLRGYIPGSYEEKTGLSRRFSKNERWTGILQNSLGNNFNVIEEGLNGRTSSLDEVIPGRPYRNGLSNLSMVLESHYPIDLVVFMLGTNDTKTQFNPSAEKIGIGMRSVVQLVKKSNWGSNGCAPSILIIAPVPLGRAAIEYDQINEESIHISEKIALEYERIANEEGCAFFDAGRVIQISEKDGVHFEASEHLILGQTLAEIIKGL